MSAAPGRARRRLRCAGVAGALAALTLLSAAPAAAATDNTQARPADHTVVYGGLPTESSAPRDLRADAGDTISFENHTTFPAVTPVRVTVGTDILVVGRDPVLWTATKSVRYDGSYTMLPGRSFTITVLPPSPAPNPPGGGGSGGTPPPAGPPAGSTPGQGAGSGTGTGTQQAPAAQPAVKPVVPPARPGDPGYIPAGAGIAPMTGHRDEHADPVVGTGAVPGIEAITPRASTHKASMSGPGSAPLPVRVALAVFAGLMLAGVGSALARILFRAWLNAAPTTA